MFEMEIARLVDRQKSMKACLDAVQVSADHDAFLPKVSDSDNCSTRWQQLTGESVERAQQYMWPASVCM